AKDYTNKNERRKNILSLIDATKEKSYYPQIMDLIVATNKGLNKEWTKNGKYFENKMEFYDAYLSDDYKQILKDKKKK
ncbi:MAG: hypothetical protein LBC68_09535, partial [Prevotellaceae bacterium]|nr:hypothetical protein [Prevotellaceae bacterium]